MQEEQSRRLCFRLRGRRRWGPGVDLRFVGVHWVGEKKYTRRRRRDVARWSEEGFVACRRRIDGCFLCRIDESSREAESVLRLPWNDGFGEEYHFGFCGGGWEWHSRCRVVVVQWD